MKIEVFGALTLKEASKQVIASIDYKNYEILHYVVVPDRFSMQAEKLVFECLNIDSTFNIKVVGISKLAEEMLRQCGVEFENVTNLETLLLTNTSISNVLEKLTYYKKILLLFVVILQKSLVF